jgi:hypothetical protein
MRHVLAILGGPNPQMGALPMIWDEFVPRYFRSLARRVRDELTTRLQTLQQTVQAYWGDPNFPSPLDFEIQQIMQDIEALENQIGDITWAGYNL